MDTTILYAPEVEETLYEIPQDGPESTLLRMRTDMQNDTLDNIELTASNISEREFVQFFRQNHLMNEDTVE